MKQYLAYVVANLDRMQFPLHTTVSQHFFGRPLMSGLKDLPSSLDHLIQALPPYHTYTVDSIIDQHTHFPLYAYFLPFERALALRQGLKANGSTVFNINIAGARRSGIPHLQWLRYCPECINQDRITYGECYWHRLHQIPWVLVCPLHEVMLEDSSVNLIYGNKFAQFCSAERSVKNLSCRKASLHLRAALQQLARNTQWLLEQPILVEREYLDRQYMGLLVKQGFSTSTGQMRYGRLKEAMLDYYPAHLLEDLGCDISQRSCWLENWRKIQHPLHHLLLIQLLCETLQKFFTQPQQPPAPFGSGPWPCLNPLCSHYKVRIITSYTLREGHLNHPIGTFTCSCGFSYSRTGPDANDDAIFHAGRISQFGDLWDQHLTAYWLDQNISTTRIAQQMHSTFSTVCRQAARLGLPFAPDIPCRGKRPKIYQDFIQEQRSLYNDFLKRVHINSTTSNRPTIKQLAKIAYSSLRAGTLLGEQIPEKCLEHQEEVVAGPEIRAAITSRSLASAFFNKQMILPNEEACQGRLTYDPFSILLLTVAAVVNGAESVYSVAHWGYQNEDLLHWFGFPKGRFPAYDTLQRTYAILDINSFESILKTWLSETFPLFQNEIGETKAHTGSIYVPGIRQLRPYQQVASEIVARLC